jgi:Family of unknown function (DUF5995)
MDGSSIEQQLIAIASGTPPATIADAITRMQAIDSVLPNSDGLKWFNLLYLTVTEQLANNPPAGGWEDAGWLARLDVVFAQFYFTAVLNALNGSGNAPKSWQALFEARFRPGVERIQLALAGMNAHINHDLALALLQTNAELNLAPSKASPQHDDFETVNGILESVLPQALEFLATGILGELAEDTGKIGRLLAIWNVRAARDLAWDLADQLRTLPGPARTVTLAMQDQITGVLGRSLLLAV